MKSDWVYGYDHIREYTQQAAGESVVKAFVSDCSKEVYEPF